MCTLVVALRYACCVSLCENEVVIDWRVVTQLHVMVLLDYYSDQPPVVHRLSLANLQCSMPRISIVLELHVSRSIGQEITEEIEIVMGTVQDTV